MNNWLNGQNDKVGEVMMNDIEPKIRYQRKRGRKRGHRLGTKTGGYQQRKSAERVSAEGGVLGVICLLLLCWCWLPIQMRKKRRKLHFCSHK